MNKYSINNMNKNDASNKKQDKKFVRTNYNIRSTFSRVIENGKPPRIIRTDEAIEYANSLGMDLVEIGYDKNNNCSNCKICDYSKFLYEQKKREKEAKKQARANKVDVKAVQMTLTTDVADKERVIKHAKDFLAEGNKVKISIRFRNRRELESTDLAKALMKEVLTSFEGLAVIDSAPGISNKELFCVLRKA